MLINWKKDHVLTVPKVDVNYKGFLVSKDVLLWFTPGWNEITDDDWAIIFPHVRGMMDAEDLEIYAKKRVADDEAKTVTFEGQDLEDVRADKAREIVKNCFNPPLLKKWQDNMKLATEIRHLVDRQIEMINKGDETTPMK